VIPAPVPFLDEHERHLITIARPEK